MTGVAERGTTIARVRLRGGGGDPLAARLGAAQVLALAGDLSDAVPPAAILCVRRLADPQPGRVALAARTAPPGWSRAVRDRVQDLARRAARPARDAVDGGAEAVIFADRAELLACLARDWCRGALGRWWWPPLVGEGMGLDTILRAWLDAPTHVAAALEHAASMRAAVGFVRRLPPPAARALFEAIASSHALTRLAGLTARPAPPARAPARAGDAPGIEASGPASSPHAGPEDLSWQAWAPEAGDITLRSDQQLVLGVALTVRRAPVHARSAAFASAVAAWWTPGVHVEHERAEPRPPAPDAETMASAVTQPMSIVDSSLVHPDAGRAIEAGGVDVRVTAPHGGDRHEQVAPAGPVRPVDAPRGARGGESAEERVAIETQYAGVFYLLNVALALELYGDFTRPAAPGLDLSIWDFVALVGQRLLPGEAIHRDPVWALLGALAGREPGEPPGAGFEPPHAWRIPPEWLHAFSAGDKWRWAAAGDRVRVRHPAGFLVLDVPRTSARAAAQVEGELAAYGARARRAARAVTCVTPGDPLDRWLAWLVPWVRARLARALGMPRRAGVGRTVCRVFGRVVATATRVDVVLPLADQPIAIRLAGLDRDPGWIPAADRVVAFEFV